MELLNYIVYVLYTFVKNVLKIKDKENQRENSLFLFSIIISLFLIGLLGMFFTLVHPLPYGKETSRAMGILFLCVAVPVYIGSFLYYRTNKFVEVIEHIGHSKNNIYGNIAVTLIVGTLLMIVMLICYRSYLYE